MTLEFVGYHCTTKTKLRDRYSLYRIERKKKQCKEKELAKFTFEQPGVNAPGTANNTTFLLAHKSAMFTLFAGESSYKSTLGILSPAYKCQNKIAYHLKRKKNYYKITDCIIIVVVSVSKFRCNFH